MTGVDKSQIRPGDKVKIRHDELVSEDWMDVTENVDGVLCAGKAQWFINGGYFEVIAHQPAPRKVEVTLGEPLTSRTRGYVEPSWSSLAVARLTTNDHALYFATGDGSTVVEFDTARRLALDILATVGVEE
jgi:hypothetical protein